MDFEVYCDESRQDAFCGERRTPDAFVLLGSLWIEASKRPQYKAALHQLRDRHSLHGEFKWNKVSPSRLDFYTDLIEFFFREDIRFRCFVAKAEELDSVHFHEADEELMFYKFYYQLLHHWVLDRNRYRVFVDTKTNRVRNRLRILRDVLRNANLTSEIVDVQALPSRELDLLQLADLLLGAVGYTFHRCKGSAAKSAVVEAIETFIGRPIGPTSRDVSKFNVFRFRPAGGW